MATDEDVQHWLDSVTYRPGARLSVEYIWGHLPILVVDLLVQNSYEPEVEIRVRHQHHLPPVDRIRDRDDFLQVLRRCLHQTEMHESDEWLRDSLTLLPLFDPHATKD